MATPLPGFTAINASTEVPLEMLSACHGRVQAQCATLQRLLDHLPNHGADRAATEAAQAVLRYFRQAAPHHHADEEADLFPALRKACPPRLGPRVATLTDALSAEHRMLEALWAPLQAELDAVASGQAAALRATTVGDFVDAYARHIEREETELLPLAAQCLDATALDRLGQAMRERRGIAAG